MFLQRQKHVKIMAQVYDKWSFQIEAPSVEAFACLSDWITLNTNSHNGGPAAPTSRTVGFSHTPAIDLGESEADTYRADDDE